MSLNPYSKTSRQLPTFRRSRRRSVPRVPLGWSDRDTDQVRNVAVGIPTAEQERLEHPSSSSPSARFWENAPLVKPVKQKYTRAHLLLYVITKGYTIKYTESDNYELFVSPHSVYTLNDFKAALEDKDAVPVNKIDIKVQNGSLRNYIVSIPADTELPPLLKFILALLRFSKDGKLSHFSGKDIYGTKFDFKGVETEDPEVGAEAKQGAEPKPLNWDLVASTSCSTSDLSCPIHLCVQKSRIESFYFKVSGEQPLPYDQFAEHDDFLPRLCFLSTGYQMSWDQEDQCFYIYI